MSVTPAPAAGVEAFFVRDGEVFLPTDYPRGPWSAESMHGSPPSALLVTEALRALPRSGARVARVAVEILGPVPLVPLTVAAAVVRPGRSVELIEASLTAGDREVLRARIWRIRTAEGLDVPAEVSTPEPAPGSPEHGREAEFFTGTDYVGYHNAIDARFVAGSWTDLGPATVWLRMRTPLVYDEPVSPLARVLTVADCGNGVSNALDFSRWVFVNPDFVVHLVRDPVGEWVCLDALTTTSSDGIGLAETRLYDEVGHLGRGAQSLFIDRRPS